MLLNLKRFVSHPKKDNFFLFIPSSHSSHPYQNNYTLFPYTFDFPFLYFILKDLNQIHLVLFLFRHEFIFF